MQILLKLDIWVNLQLMSWGEKITFTGLLRCRKRSSSLFFSPESLKRRGGEGNSEVQLEKKTTSRIVANNLLMMHSKKNRKEEERRICDVEKVIVSITSSDVWINRQNSSLHILLSHYFFTSFCNKSESGLLLLIYFASRRMIRRFLLFKR